MRDVPENELFSAYLDGELSAAEQARVEELLARSPRARQLLDEFRALSSTLQSLPPHKLDEDLSDRVLRLAERRLLAERPTGRAPSPAPSASTAPPVPGPPPLEADGRSRLRRMLSPRALGWSIMAVAVALLIMALDPGQLADKEGDRDVARATGGAAEAMPDSDEPPASGASEEAGDRIAAGGEVGAEEAFKGEGTNAGVAGKGPAGPSFTEAGGAGLAAEPEPTDVAAGVPPARESYVAKPGVPADGARDADRAEAHDRISQSLGAAPSAPPSAEMPFPAEEPAAPGPSAPAPAIPAEPDGSAVADATPPPAVQPGAEQPVTAPQEFDPHQLAANGNPDGNGKVEGKGPRGGFELPAGRGGGAGAAGQGTGGVTQFGTADGAALGDRVEPSPDDAVLLVHCDVSPGAAQSRLFDRLLVDNGIRWEGAKSKMRRGQQEQDSGAGRLPEMQKKQEHEEQLEQRTLSEEVEDEAAGPVEVVYVEASLAQIESTLAALNGRPREFMTVSVKPASGMAWQKGFSYRYNREPGLEIPTPDEPPRFDEMSTPRDLPALGQLKTGADAPDEGGQLSVDGFGKQQPPGSQSEPKAAPIQPGEPIPLQVGQPAPVQTEQTAEGEPAERPEPPAEAEGVQGPGQPVPQRPFAEGPGVESSRLAGTPGRAQRLTLPGGEPAADREAPGLRSRAGQDDAYSDLFGGHAPRPPRKAPGAYREPSGRRPADKKPAEPRLYRVLFVLRVVPPGNLASQAVASDGPAARAAEAAVEAMPEAAPAEPPPSSVPGGAPPP
jgi:hypothetical protein